MPTHINTQHCIKTKADASLHMLDSDMMICLHMNCTDYRYMARLLLLSHMQGKTVRVPTLVEYRDTAYVRYEVYGSRAESLLLYHYNWKHSTVSPPLSYSASQRVHTSFQHCFPSISMTRNYANP